jgi:hypothetical protein
MKRWSCEGGRAPRSQRSRAAARAEEASIALCGSAGLYVSVSVSVWFDRESSLGRDAMVGGEIRGWSREGWACRRSLSALDRSAVA